MFTVIASAVFLVGGLIVLSLGRKLKKARGASEGRGLVSEIPSIAPIAIGTIALVISAAILASGVFTQVTAKNAGVLVSFGKVSEKTLSPGLHMKLPWQKVVEIDGTIQTDEYRADSCIQVRIGDGSQACVSITNRWSVVESEADRVYKDFKSDDPTLSFRDAVISTQLKASLQKALSDYNPVAQFNGANKEASSAELSFSPDYDAVSKVVEDDMKARLGDQAMAQVESITISYMQLSENTQKKLDDYVASIGETRIAEQKQQTAAAQAEANRLLSSSVSNDPNVLVSKCMDTMAEAAESGYQLPAGFSCWPGTGGSVVIPGTR